MCHDPAPWLPSLLHGEESVPVAEATRPTVLVTERTRAVEDPSALLTVVKNPIFLLTLQPRKMAVSQWIDPYV